MGIANIIPGVSGGTIALITNIYEDLIFSLKSFNYRALKLLLNLKFKDFNLQDVDLSENKGKIMILNFWATWCAPCKKEMPSLSRLAKDMPELKIFAINMEKPNQTKAKKFFDDLNIDNLDIYFDPKFNLAKKFKMRGLQTKILIDKNCNEFARIIGEIDFDTKDFKKIIRKNS